MSHSSLFSSTRGPLTLERGRLPAADGLIGVIQKSKGNGRATAVTHSFSIVADVQVLSGTFYFPLAHGTVVAPPRFLMVIPPRSLVPIAHADSSSPGAYISISAGVAGKIEVGTARLLHREGPPLILSRQGILQALEAEMIAGIAVDEGLPTCIVRARHHLHELLAHPAPVREAARRAGVTGDTLTRQFRAAYSLTPKAYCHRARLSDAVLHLSAGVNILETVLQCGFNDLSRSTASFAASLVLHRSAI
jgi:AraC-like DNA-binding protein